MKSYDASAILNQGGQFAQPKKNRGSEAERGESEGGKTPQASPVRSTVIIYCLSCPAGELRYVGKTTGSLSNRLRQHLTGTKNSYLASWIKHLSGRGERPVIEELERIENSDDTDWQEVERFWIVHLRFLGCRLVNLDAGGNGGNLKCDETKQKIGAAHRGRVHSAETREKFRLSHLGKRLSPEHCANMSRAVKGIRRGLRPPEVMEKVAAHNRGSKRPRTPEHQAKLTQLQIGRKRSLETRAKIRAAQLGKKRGNYSEAHRAAISASLKGRVVPEDQKRKMSESAKRRWAKEIPAPPTP